MATGAPKSGGPFEKGAEGEADDQHLQALVRRDGENRRADDVELPGLHRNFIDEDRGDDDPRDWPQAVEEAVDHGGQARGRPAFCRRASATSSAMATVHVAAR